ncbi:MAG: hypothetical protein ABIH90_02460, partial [Candidatus Aenigmatarchaeota archaeon]
MKGQMFIITMVFLMGLVVFVSQLLLSYSIVDVSDIPDRTGVFVVEEYNRMINDTIQSSRNCTDANNSIKEMNSFLGRLVTEGYHSQILYDKQLVPDVDCQKFNDLTGTEKLFDVDMEVITGSTEVRGVYGFYRNFIVFDADPTCRISAKEIWSLNLLCKSEDPEEADTCIPEWVSEYEDCEICTDTDPTNDELVFGNIELVPACSLDDTVCPNGMRINDVCEGDNVIESTCSIDGINRGDDIPKNCNDHDQDECVTQCNAGTGNIDEMCNDWTCVAGKCDDSGLDWPRGQVEDCTPRCVETDLGNDKDHPGTLTTYLTCSVSDTECPKSIYTDSCNSAEIPRDTLTEYYCSGAAKAQATIDCDPDNHGEGCQSGYCYDCDGDNDGWCEYPEDRYESTDYADCDNSDCPIAHPDAD